LKDSHSEGEVDKENTVQSEADELDDQTGHGKIVANGSEVLNSLHARPSSLDHEGDDIGRNATRSGLSVSIRADA
jgi:hypothetical protein